MATPSRAPEPRRFTREEYYRMYDAGLFRDERVELLDGEIIAMGPKNPPHASSVARISMVLTPRLAERYSVRVQLPISLDDWSEPEPDFVVCTLDPDSYASGHPTPGNVLLLIEVADASLAFDRKRKRAAYARADIPGCWIVNVPDRFVEVSQRPDRAAKRYRVRRAHGPARSRVCPTARRSRSATCCRGAEAGCDRRPELADKN
ncbi:MAG: Uma2 family endonuclease [Thermodesulfobacteriota bacterium]